ncbi:MAG: ferrous iron transport protein B [Gammaproteobacteria bacterium]|nr:ferrous iron transport protein B [Gammaproteobacteria bacterium]
MPRRPLIAVLGCPNTGKSTVFNRLTGLRQRTGNYPGVTVEKITGVARLGKHEVELVDLPGTYSLAADGPESGITLDVVLGMAEGIPRPDALLLVADATNLRRSLYLFSQTRELGLPVAVALNMQDVAKRQGETLDAQALAGQLLAPVAPMTANRGKGIQGLRSILQRLLAGSAAPAAAIMPEVREEAAKMRTNLGTPAPEIPCLERAIIDTGGEFERRLLESGGQKAREVLETTRGRLHRQAGRESLQSREARRRYGQVDEWLAGIGVPGRAAGPARTGWVERMVSHPVTGPIVFLAVMSAVFQAVFAWATPLMDAISTFFEDAGALALATLPAGALSSLLIDGLWSGVGAVVVFVPQIVFLFALVLFLEDCGYMARASFLMDRLLRICGLSGQSFIPLLSGFACAVPAIMATRVVGDRRARLATIVAIPLMTCSARLPVYALLISGFVPPAYYLNGWINLHGLILLGLYLLGIAGGAASAFLTRRIALRGAGASFFMEMPPFRWPNARVLALKLTAKVRVFLTRAGTVIAAACVMIWALGYFPRSDLIANDFANRRADLAVLAEEPADMQTRLRRLNAEERAAQLEYSLLGRVGKTIEPVFRPLGWDWRVSASVVAGFPAREVVIGVMGTVYALGSESEDSVGLRERLQASRWPDGRPVFTLAMALGLLVFYAFALQCVSTVAVIGRETNSWRWAAGAWIYMSGFAWLAGMLTYQVAA